MSDEKKPTTDAVEILKRRYNVDERVLECERAITALEDIVSSAYRTDVNKLIKAETRISLLESTLREARNEIIGITLSVNNNNATIAGLLKTMENDTERANKALAAIDAALATSES